MPDSSPPLQVLHLLCGTSLNGGAETVVQEIVNLPIQGCEQHVWMHQDSNIQNDVVIPQGVAQYANRSFLRDFIDGIRESIVLSRWIGKRRNLVLHAHSRVGVIAGSIVGWKLRIPVIHHCHTLPNYLWIYNILLRLCKGNRIYNSSKTRSHFKDLSDAVTIMPGIGIWPDRAPKFNSPVTRIIACGSFTPGKHLVELTKAFSYLEARLDNLELHLFGAKNDDSPYENQVRRLVANNPKVNIHPWSANWTESLCSSDILVHLGEPESFGIVILEAFAKGIRLAVLPDTFLDEVGSPELLTGVTQFETTNPIDIADGIIRALQVSHSSNWYTERAQYQNLFGAKGQKKSLQKLYYSI